MSSSLHHVEFCVGEEQRLLELLVGSLGFQLVARHLTGLSLKWVLKHGKSVFVVTRRRKDHTHTHSHHHQNGFGEESEGENNEHEHERNGVSSPRHQHQQHSTAATNHSIRQEEEEGEDWTVFCCEEKPHHTIDSLFNLALVVRDVDDVTQRVRQCGGRVLREPADVCDSFGCVRYSVVTSNVGNVVHTLIDKRQYSGPFLPKFEMLDHCVSNGHLPNGTVNDENLSNGTTNSQDLPNGTINNENLSNGTTNHQDLPNGTVNGGYLSNSTINNGKCEELEEDLFGFLEEMKDKYEAFWSSRGLPKDLLLFTHIDHVAVVCDIGQTKELMSWYEHCFGMKRFITNRSEDEEEGFVLRDSIGLRLKAMEYWRCAETGLTSPPPLTTTTTTTSSSSDNNGDNCDRDPSFKMVIAEPLKECPSSHVRAFLDNHRGPGVQHLALHTPSMAPTVMHVSQKGMKFRLAPPAYYQKDIRLEDIIASGHGHELDLFQRLGILVDTEDDVFTDAPNQQQQQQQHQQQEQQSEKKMYLLQVFTTQIFKEDTFFMEVIQREGAQGFGAGNIQALAQSIVYEKKRKEAEAAQAEGAKMLRSQD